MGCAGKQTPKDTHDHEAHEVCQSHDGHDHETEGHNHEAEDHDHEGEGLDHQHEGEDGHPAGEIVFTKEQAAETDFALHKVEPITFYEVIPASGQILAAQGDEATVVATVSGVVSFSSKKLSEGASVSRGENLFYISSKNIAEGDYTARTRAAFAQAKAAYAGGRSEQDYSERHGRRSAYRGLYQKHSCQRRAIRRSRAAAGHYFAKPQAETQSRSFATLSRCTADHLECELQNLIRRQNLFAQRSGRTARVGRESFRRRIGLHSCHVRIRQQRRDRLGIVRRGIPDLITQTEHADGSGHGADRRTGQLLGFRPDR